MSSSTLADRVLAAGGRALITGGNRSDREIFAGELSAALEKRRIGFALLATDVGFPLVGPPGAVVLARPEGPGFRVEGLEAICSLDAARFRLPLLLAARRIAARLGDEVLLVEAPGVTRGMAGAELVSGLVESLGIGLVVRVGEAGVGEELRARAIDVLDLAARASLRSRPAGGDRARGRTEAWARFLEHAEERSVPWNLPAVGAPPPREAVAAWRGRQLALLGAEGETLAFGEVEDAAGDELRCRLRRLGTGTTRALLLRDARRDRDSLLATERVAVPRAPERSDVHDLHARDAPPAESLKPPVISLTTAKALLVNGIFGDPLLHVRLRHRKRSLLFDLGEAARLPARIVHQVSDVFVSHAHFDHIGGFLWLLRSSIGAPRPRRLYGPPDLADRIEGMIGGILWDRIGDRGPVFEVIEVHEARSRRFLLRAGKKGRERLEDGTVEGGVVLDEPDFRIRVATLDHGVPVLSFAFEETRALHVRREVLAESGLAPGPWLSELKRLVLANGGDALVELPDGSRRRGAELASDLLTSSPGERIVYATDFSDSDSNRDALVALARGARVLFCEASFLEEDRHLARATQHLTARACGEIAAAAGVAKLVPFHFSKRYEHEPDRVYREVQSFYSGTMVVAS